MQRQRYWRKQNSLANKGSAAAHGMNGRTLLGHRAAAPHAADVVWGLQALHRLGSGCRRGPSDPTACTLQHGQPRTQWGCRQRPTGAPPKGAARRPSAFLQPSEQLWLMQTCRPADQGEPHFFLFWTAHLTPSPVRTILAGHAAGE